ncbi:uncharacterized protein DUF1640 [Rhodothalassium salexigens DSM 2132]|uniref:Uncharacterized protein DUF1640 n=1 Tax=Rhodothalassium salexigens DSM 2132 TaxID=1188247 RepID=A0A4R2P7A5_RHOSA|nr:DUF1640 domain-containing protein [Rhodothalassium salexigens]MBB4212639.1 hypothetical protein [Rhodothalassium salexigens DSM 2132]MBK1638747.1 hypothetical protein [Rhodothalassium salexigens DSM 2132]TCP30763.1 uncharacterized protein DUF1640 [Rhodothalassium salexigens DSM 2132]
MEDGNGGVDARDLGPRVSHLETRMTDVETTLRRIEPVLNNLDGFVRASLPNLATRTELHDLRNEIHSDMENLRSEVRADMQNLRGELHTDIQGLRGDLATMAAKLDATLPHLATQAEVMKRPVRAEMLGYMSVILVVLGLLIRFP